MTPHDRVDQAFEQLRRVKVAEQPDPALEALLRERHPASRSDRTREGERSSHALRRWWIPLTAVAALSGGALAAAGGIEQGLEWLRGWWYGIEIDGVTAQQERMDRDGERVLHFSGGDAGEGTVTVKRDTLPGDAVRTEISIARESAKGIEHEASVDVHGDAPPTRRHPRAILDEALWIHEGEDRLGVGYRIYARLDGSGGTRLLLDRPDLDGDTVEEMLTLPFELTEHGLEYRFEERENGGLELTVNRGAQFERVFLWAQLGAGKLREGQPAASQLETSDGAIRVRVQDGSGDG